MDRQYTTIILRLKCLVTQVSVLSTTKLCTQKLHEWLKFVFILSSLGIPQRSIKDVKTDAFILEKIPNKHKAFVENIANVTFKDLPNLRRKYQKVTVNQTFLDANGVNVKGISSEDKVLNTVRRPGNCRAHTLSHQEHHNSQWRGVLGNN